MWAAYRVRTRITCGLLIGLDKDHVWAAYRVGQGSRVGCL